MLSVVLSARTVGAEGIEPSNRARQMGICRAQGGSSIRYCLIKDLLSTTELRAAAIAGQSQRSGAEGSRTLTVPLKRRTRCRYATTPSMEWAYPFQSSGLSHVKFSSVFSCPRWSRTTAGDVSDRYASVTTPDSREGGSRTRDLVLPRHARHRSSSSRFFVSPLQ